MAGPDQAIRKVPVGRWTGWYACAWRLFAAHPLVWVGWLLILVVCQVVLALIPLVGGLLASWLGPVLMGGVYYGIQRQASGGAPRVADCFRVFRDPRRRGPMLVLGALFVGLNLVLMFALFAGLMSAVVPQLPWEALQRGEVGPEAWRDFTVTPVMVVWFVFLSVLITVIVMAIWFAPLLVMLGGREPAAALGESLHGCLRNWAPLGLYLLGLTILGIVAIIPFLLGLLVLVPWIYGTLYCSYRDIFVQPAPEPGAGTGGAGEFRA